MKGDNQAFLKARLEQIRALGERLTRPPANLVEPETRRQSRLLQSILISVIFSGTMILLFQIFQFPESIGDMQFWLATGIWPLSFILYRVTRQGHTNRAAGMLIAMLFLLFTVSPFTIEHIRFLPFYIILPVLLTALFFSMRWTFIITGLSGLVLVVLYLTQTPANRIEHLWLIENTFFVFPISILILVYIREQRTVDQTQRTQLQAAYDHLMLSEAELEKRVEDRTHELQISEQSLREAQHRYYSLFEQAHDAVFILDFKGRHVQVNRRAADMLGYTIDELLTLSVRETSAQVPQSLGVIDRLLAGEHIPVYERQFRHKDGHNIPVEINLELVRDREGKPLHVQSVVRDISERKAAERQIRLQSTALAAAANAVMITDREGRIEWSNPAFSHLTGYTAEESLGKNPRELVRSGKHEREYYQDLWQTILDGRTWHGHLLNRRKDGTIYTEEQTITPVRDDSGAISHFVAIKQDVTERGRAETALRESEARYRGMFENNQAVKMLIEPDSGRILDANTAATEFYGYSLDTLLNMRIQDINTLSEEEVKAEMASAQNENRKIFHFRHRLASGEIRDVEVYSGPLESEGKRLLYSIILDVTARLRAEEALRESETRYRLLAENVGEVISRILPDGVRTFITPSCFNLLGYTPEEMLGHRAFNDLHPEDSQSAFEIMNRALESGQTHFDITARMCHKAGHYIWCEVNATIVREADSGAPVEIISIIHDITERKRVEDALRESEARYQSVVQSQTELICRYKPDLTLIFVNNAYCRYFDKSPEDLIGRSFLDLIPESERTGVKAFYENLVQTRGTSTYEHQVTLTNGKLHWQEWTDTVIIDANDEVTAIQAVGVDITDRKLAEIALRESENRLNNILDSMQEAVWAMELPDYKPIYFNSAVERLFGHPRSEFYEDNTLWLRLIHPDEAHHLQNVLHEVHETGISAIETRIVRPDGEIRWVYSQMWLVRDQDGKPTGLEGIVSDITGRKQVEMAQQSFLDDMRALQKIHLDLSRIDNLDTLYQQMVILPRERLGLDRVGLFVLNETGDQLSGTYGVDPLGNIRDEHYYQETVTRDHWTLDVLNMPDHVRFWSNAPINDNRMAVGTGWKAGTALWNGQRPFGYMVTDNLVSGRPPRPYETELISVLGNIFGHLLERKRSEHVLRQSEEKFRSFIESAPISTFITNEQGTIVLTNKEATRVFGYTRDELIGQNIELLVPEKIRSAHAKHQSKYHAKPERRRFGSLEVTARRKDGSIFPCDVQLSYVDVLPSPLVMSYVLDITERKMAEQTLQQALKQEKQLGELKSRFVSMASHEFRTPLASIMATAETLSYYRERLKPDQIDARLDKICQQVNHMKGIMEDVLQIARIHEGRVEFNPEMSDIDLLCREIVEEFEDQAQYQGRIQYTCNSQPLMLSFDNRLMRQVINNLVSNALKYSPGEKSIQMHLSRQPDSVILQVKDEGIGIPADDLNHLFEPFHRAANVGTISGTGLGLNIVKRAVEMHGGTITAETEVNKGTLFIVEIPSRADSSR